MRLRNPASTVPGILEMLVARRYVIGGRVQGVGFRFFTEAVATREGLHGWVQNRSDGRVEIQVEGDAEAIERFERHVRQGPPAARTSYVEVEDVPPSGHTTGFRVR